MTGDKDFDELLEKCVKVIEAKGADYARHGDRLAEFRETGFDLGISMRQALGVHLNKHIRSLKKWMRGEHLSGEPIEEKLKDIIVYCLLGYKIVKNEEHASIEEEKERALYDATASALKALHRLDHDPHKIYCPGCWEFKPQCTCASPHDEDIPF